jgi:hypothetical protein
LFDRLITIPFLGEAGAEGGEGARVSVGMSFVAGAGLVDFAACVVCVTDVVWAGVFCAKTSDGGTELGCAAGTGLRAEGTFAGDEEGEGVRVVDKGSVVMLFMFAKLGRLNDELLMSSSSVRSMTGFTCS